MSDRPTKKAKRAGAQVFTPSQVKSIETQARAAAAQGKGVLKQLTAGGGLMLIVRPTGRLVWEFRHRERVPGAVTRGGKPQYKARIVTLGQHIEGTFGLAEARAKAAELGAGFKAGRDPVRDAAAAVAAKKANTFQAIAEQYMEERKRSWAPKTQGCWRASMRGHVFPIIGAKPIAEVSLDDLKAVMGQPFEGGGTLASERPARAAQVLQRVNYVLGYAHDHDLRQRGGWGGESVKRLSLLPKPDRKGVSPHRPGLRFREVPEFMAKLTSRPECLSVLCLELLILTGLRNREARYLEWGFVQKFDGYPALVVPAHLMKKKTAKHVIPLCAESIATLCKIWNFRGTGERADNFEGLLALAEKAEGQMMFPGRNGRKPIHDPALGWAIDTTPGDWCCPDNRPICVHGFRTSIRTYFQNMFPALHTAAEHALHHGVGEMTEKAYMDDSFLPRVKMMAAWGRYVTGAVEAQQEAA